jgi:hypothetical protein
MISEDQGIRTQTERNENMNARCSDCHQDFDTHDGGSRILGRTFCPSCERKTLLRRLTLAFREDWEEARFIASLYGSEFPMRHLWTIQPKYCPGRHHQTHQFVLLQLRRLSSWWDLRKKREADSSSLPLHFNCRCLTEGETRTILDGRITPDKIGTPLVRLGQGDYVRDIYPADLEA